MTAAISVSIDLRPFCDPEVPLFAEPWVADGFRYGCNGRIAARVAAPGEPNSPVPCESRRPFPELATLFAGNGMYRWLPLPELPQCGRCKGTGYFVDSCPDCRGSGNCECDCGHRHRCGTCEGKRRCQQFCSCYAEPQFRVQLGLAWFKCQFLWLVARFPECEYVPTIGADEHLRLRFAGGEAVCMPVIIDE